MDYLDPHKQRRDQIMLYIGYFLIGIAIVMSIYLLLQLSFGFRVDRQGKVILQGVSFFSSEPNPAEIYVNGQLKSQKTNTRLSLTSGVYNVELRRSGYSTWRRSINLEGGRVAHYDYPLLIPEKLSTKQLTPTYSSQPRFSSQSPDKRWFLVASPDSLNDYQVYDLKNPTKPPTLIKLPNIFSQPQSPQQTLVASEWADDNVHLVIRHDFDGKFEYILLNREAPSESINLTNTVQQTNSGQLSLINKKYDNYYLFNQASQSLQKATLKQPIATSVLDKVLAYQSYSDDTILYTTSDKAPPNKVRVRLQEGSKTYDIRLLPTGSRYLLDLTGYDGKLNVVAGADSQNKIYIYHDPLAQINKQPTASLVPAQVLHVTSPNYLKFSSSAQFVMAENGNEIAVYDFENKIGYHYITEQPIDSPQSNASWIDGNRLTYVSSGKVFIFEYDYQNPRSLVPASSSFIPALSSDYKFIYSLKQSATPPQYLVDQTSLRTTADQ